MPDWCQQHQHSMYVCLIAINDTGVICLTGFVDTKRNSSKMTTTSSVIIVTGKVCFVVVIASPSPVREHQKPLAACLYVLFKEKSIKN
jgi:hypothetical protein